MALKKLISLDSPIRVLYHWIRGVVAFYMYGNPAKDMIVIGITGTKGKTTTSTLVAQGLRDAGHTIFMFTTAQYSIGDEIHENTSKMTSPSPFMLQRLLREARQHGCTHAIVETSSHAIYYNRIYGISFDVAVLTNISQDHLDLHKTMHHYVSTKRRLFANLVRYSRKPNIKKIAVINKDDAYAPDFLEETADIVRTYGFSKSAEFQIHDVRHLADGTKATIRLPSHEFTIHTKLRGKFNMYNVLAASAVLNSLKVGIEGMKQTFDSFAGVPGRLELVPNNFGYTIFIDYAHTEDSLKNVLETVRQIEGVNRVVTVFGCTGDRDRNKRPKMGAVVDRLSDGIVLTDDDTYTESSAQIIRDIIPGINRHEGENFWIVPDRRDAIRTALVSLQKNDVLLLAGKGSESVLVTNSGPITWSDARVTREILQEIDDNQIVQ